ncbi:S-layer homology domain-containing protein [Paenibacillus sp. RRE4]|uniref:S-layer homology domain-containing protein n=1 Tax=Paenibacillus sp. RRE4 TaxID=2962587 RepID=UPI002881400C|nr:S-layer homology domain-containing protein [Paenibacillus sp. RRE4]MDT0125408.1 S-layer homology domain-containing protein [Paenibacillus sp. RRE4]
MMGTKTKISSLLALPLAGLLLLLGGTQTAYAEQVDSLLPERSQQEIVQKWNEWMHVDQTAPMFTETPSTVFPYSAGLLNERYLEQGLNAANFYRYIAGMSGDLVLDPTLNMQAQHGAVVVSTGGQLSHSPEQPADMPKDFFDKGYTSASSSNLHVTSNGKFNVLAGSIMGYMNDSDASNIDRVGHRRWILSPKLQRIGFGLAAHQEEERTRYYNAMQVFDKSRTQVTPYNYSLFPNQGDFPIEAFGALQAWSVQLNRDVFAKPELEKVQVEMIRTSDQRKWTFNQQEKTEFPSEYYNVDPSNKRWFEQAYFNVETTNFGDNSAIIFRPDDIQLFKNGDTFQVHITGLQKKDGSPAEISYTTRFFHIDGRQEPTLTQIRPAKSDVTLRVGETADIPLITAILGDGTSYTPYSNLTYTTSSDKIVIRNGRIAGTKVGKAELHIRFGGKETVVSVTVKKMPNYTDIQNHWAKHDILWAIQQNMVSGDNDTFRPNDQVSEAEFLSMLFNMYANTKYLKNMETAQDKGTLWSDRYYTYAARFNLPLEASIQNPKLRKHALNRTEVAVIIASLGGRNYVREEDNIQYLLNMGYSSGKTSATVEGYAGKELFTRAEAVVFLRNLKGKGFEPWGRPEQVTETGDNEKQGNLPDGTVQAEYTVDHTLTLRGTFKAYAGHTIPIDINGPSPEVLPIQTENVTLAADGSFKLTVKVNEQNTKHLNLYLNVKEDYTYWIRVEEGKMAVNEYTEG